MKVVGQQMAGPDSSETVVSWTQAKVIVFVLNRKVPFWFVRSKLLYNICYDIKGWSFCVQLNRAAEVKRKEEAAAARLRQVCACRPQMLGVQSGHEFTSQPHLGVSALNICGEC